MEWTDILSYFCLAFYGLATVATLIGLLGRSAAAKRLAVLFCTCGFAAGAVFEKSLWLLCNLFKSLNKRFVTIIRAQSRKLFVTYQPFKK